MFSIDSGGHLRRYVTTLGVALIAAATFFGRTLLDAAEVLTIPEAEIRGLTPSARGTIQQQQELAANVAAVGPWVVGLVALAGLILAGWGLRGWSMIQKAEDDGRTLDLEKKRAEVRALSPEERVTEVIREEVRDSQLAALDPEFKVLGELEIRGDGGVGLVRTGDTVSLSAERIRQIVGSLRSRSGDVTGGFVSRFEQQFPEEHLIRYSRISAGGSEGYFDVAVGRDGEMPDGQPIYRVRHIANGVSRKVLLSWVEGIRLTAKLWGDVQPVLVVVVEHADMADLVSDMLSDVTDVKVVVLSQQQLETMSAERFFAAVGLLGTKWWLLRKGDAGVSVPAAS